MPAALLSPWTAQANRYFAQNVNPAGTLCLRFQPLGNKEPLCFADVKASPRVSGPAVILTLCHTVHLQAAQAAIHA